MVIRTGRLEFVAKVELESTLSNKLLELATLYFAAGQVGQKPGNVST